jgi:2-polyprenyl-6-methoxyphenol hydroxylase-like FAD-dependent oxidoreductase
VLIVGAGPVGSVLALELARHGVSSTIVERSLTPSRYPKMDYINGRSMELLRRLDLAGEIREGGVSPRYPANFIWSRSFDEPPIAIWRYASPDALDERIAEVNDGSMPMEPYQRMQGSLLEDMLRARARENPMVDMREGWTFTSLQQDGEGVTASVVDSTTNTRHTIRARYLVACDGANSTVRQFLQLPVDEMGPRTQHFSMYFKSRDPELRRYGRAFLTITAKGLTLVSRDEEDTWTASFRVDEEPLTANPVSLMHKKLGAEFQIDDVINISQWQGTLAVASAYRSGSAFLAGDSAHHFYPVGGHGANTGIGDAVDLGWKLAAMINGWGGPKLIDSYEAERRPVALFNRQMCANLMEVWRRFAQLSGDGVSREHLAGFLDQESYQLDNVGIHFGYRYNNSPVISGEQGPAPRWQWRSITPGTWPGGRAPSVRLPDGSQLFDQFGVAFTLVDLSGENIGELMAKEANEYGVPVAYLPVSDPTVRAVWERDLVLVRPDQHVAWRGSRIPETWTGVLNHVIGR